MQAAEVEALLGYLTDAERLELAQWLSVAPKWIPLPGPQAMAYTSEADIIGYGGAAGGGKGLALDTPIPTPSGWVLMGDLQVGDTVFDESGAACKVTAVSQVSYRPCYRLTFDDGSAIVADDVHRWVTFDAKDLLALTKRCDAYRARRREKRPSKAGGKRSAAFTAAVTRRNRTLKTPCKPAPTGTMRDTQSLADTLLTPRGRRNHAIRVAGALQGDGVDLPIQPYTLGAWLGDGTSSNCGFTCAELPIIERIRADGYTVSDRKNSAINYGILGIQAILRGMGLLGNKHIPPQYLRASYGQRLALLQGLMDTDGHATMRGACEFDNTNEALVDGVLELVLSLGIKATKQRGTAKLGGRVIGDKWRVKFTTTLPVFNLPRKLERLAKETRRTTQFRYLVACDAVESVPTKCIAVDSPTRQYLAGRAMIPTHNTDLACGKALTQHQRIMILRREATQLTGIIDRLKELVGNADGYNGAEKIWRMDGRQIEFGSTPNLGDWSKYQGRPHDLLVFDEAANFLEAQVRALLGWLRSVDPNQRCQALLTFNPPTTVEGRWVIDFFAPWLDRAFHKPAEPGELRYCATIGGRDVWLDDGREFVIVDGKPCYDLADHQGEAVVKPLSRTFIPSKVTDNPYLMNTGYMATLQALPEPLRSQMLNGDFSAGLEDDPWQVIPTAWVEAAQARWQAKDVKPPMDSMGVDVARGGKDETIVARRHGMWFDVPLAYAGSETPNGPATAGLVIAALRDKAPIHVDVIGVGSSVYDFLREAGQQTLGVNVAEKARVKDKSGRLTFRNLRSQLWWQMREALDPDSNTGIALPPDKRLLADLCTPTWRLQGSEVYVESREDIVKKLGRSPDYASAYLLALMDTPKAHEFMARGTKRGLDYDPYRDI